MKPQSGFTLVEAMMAGIISAFIPLTVLAVLNMNGSQLQKGTSRLRLTQIYDVVSEEIHRTAYASASARQAPCVGTHLDQYCGVLFRNVDGSHRKGFRVRLPYAGSPIGILEEAVAGPTAWIPFRVGTETVTVSTNIDAFAHKVPGFFNVYNPTNDDKKVEGLRFNLRISMAVGGGNQAISVQTESVLCRMAPPWTDI